MLLTPLPLPAREPSLPFDAPIPGASLLLAFHPAERTILIIGSGRLAASRARAALESGARVVVTSHRSIEEAYEEVRWRVAQGEITWVQTHEMNTQDDMAGFLNEVEDVVLVCVTDTLLSASGRERAPCSAAAIHAACRARRIPVNVADMPLLCDFTFPATHRVQEASIGKPGSLQIAVTTNGRSCRLAGRIRREMVAALPKTLGDAVARIGTLRRLAKSRDCDPAAEECDDDADATLPPINAPAPQHNSSVAEQDRTEAARRRMRWVSQISEFWPIERIAGMRDEDMEGLLESNADKSRMKEEVFVDEGYVSREGSIRERPALSRCPSRSPPADASDSNIPASGTALPLSAPAPTAPPASSNSSLPSSDIELTQSKPGPSISSRHSLQLSPSSPPSRQGRILLLGSGPGHPSLLTLAAHTALTQLATVVLADKLVPSQVLAIIPPTTELHIAKKFPGNAEGAQSELIEMALEAARRGETVVRLKQGDPFLYGRGGDEVLVFRAAGFEPLVVPGVSSALAGPLLAGIPVTQRGVAESLTICTGVGRQGREVSLPGYERGRTLCVLMGVAQLARLIRVLLDPDVAPSRRTGAPYPPHTPVAIVERASCPDQRCISTTLDRIESAMERVGEGRAPGMIVVGWAVLCLEGKGEVTVLDDMSGDGDEERVERWLGEKGYIVQEGMAEGWRSF